MAGVHEFEGRAASPGISLGPAFVAETLVPELEPKGEPGAEMEVLSEAIDRSLEALRALAAKPGKEGAGVLDFQIEMLRDPSLLELVAERVAAGEGAARAWVGVLDAYIAEIRGGGDELAGTRVADMIDIKIRVLAALSGKSVADFPAGAVFFAEDMEPSLFLSHDWSHGGGIVLFGGSVGGSVAALARGHGVPMVVETGGLPLTGGETVLIDGDAGRIEFDPSDDEMVAARGASEPESTERVEGAMRPALRTADGVEIGLSVDISDPADVAGLDRESIDGIGLMRTEFLMSSSSDIADEERQVAIYRQALEWAADKPVVIRMFDFGSDKLADGIAGIDREMPMGLRGIRLLLALPDLARIQARALLRAGSGGHLEVLLPMVTLPSELEGMRRIFVEEQAHLQRRGFESRLPPIGIMVEAPATALMIDRFLAADFFTFGTNDLARHLMAAGRDNPALADLYTQAEPAVLRLVGYASRIIQAMGKPVNVCGGMASELDVLPRLLAAGLRHFSVAPKRIGPVRSALAALHADGTAEVDK